ncbi:Ada Methylated DNA-protein cysteine methyltransferase [Burkholderiaceae bacterium]|jgi:methylated-DNA-[protein]-cysteine S-methyltransferase
MPFAQAAHTSPFKLWQMPINTPLGRMRLVAGEAGLAGAWFDHQQHRPDIDQLPWGPSLHWLREAKQQIGEYFAGQRHQFELQLEAVHGSRFQQQVWQALRVIPYGRFTSYGELAAHLNHPKGARAVGMAIGRNPWSVIVPCHRVVGANGALTGYAGGIERKLALLKHEGMLL